MGATAGCLRRRARLAEMLLDMGELDEAEKLLRRVLEYVEAAHVRLLGWLGGLQHGSAGLLLEYTP